VYFNQHDKGITTENFGVYFLRAFSVRDIKIPYNAKKKILPTFENEQIA